MPPPQQLAQCFQDVSHSLHNAIGGCNNISSLHREATANLLLGRDVSMALQYTVHEVHTRLSLPNISNDDALLDIATQGMSKVRGDLSTMRCHMERACETLRALVRHTEGFIDAAVAIERLPIMPTFVTPPVSGAISSGGD
jgi:hypothetical protein